jgi:hypothetical protein
MENINTVLEKMGSNYGKWKEMANVHVDYGFIIRIADPPVSASR